MPADKMLADLIRDMVTTEIFSDLGIAKAEELEIVAATRPGMFAASPAVGRCAVAAVGGALLAACDLALARGERARSPSVDEAHVEAAVLSEVWLRHDDGRSFEGFAPFSRLWASADGWVRTHGNYPWHRLALLRALDVDDGPDDVVQPIVERTLAQLPARDIEHLVYSAGGLAVAARSAQQWRAEVNPPEHAPLLKMQPMSTVTAPPRPRGPLPASGLRVLDLTRVIAGPVGTRMLGAFGAEVLRIDDPHRPELPLHAVDGVIGKKSSLLDGGSEAGLDQLHALVDEADVLVTGYRPGAMARLGLDPDQMADRHPSTSVVTLSAWGTTGTWGSRRGFDSLVQVASGIGWATSVDGQRPGALPCQLLDHASGYLVAAAALWALAERERTGQVHHVEVSLERTSRWLLSHDLGPSGPFAGEANEADAYRVSIGGGWSTISPPGRLDGIGLSWPNIPPRYGQSEPRFDA